MSSVHNYRISVYVVIAHFRKNNREKTNTKVSKKQQQQYKNKRVHMEPNTSHTFPPPYQQTNSVNVYHSSVEWIEPIKRNKGMSLTSNCQFLLSFSLLLSFVRKEVCLILLLYLLDFFLYCCSLSTLRLTRSLAVHRCQRLDSLKSDLFWFPSLIFPMSL